MPNMITTVHVHIPQWTPALQQWLNKVIKDVLIINDFAWIFADQMSLFKIDGDISRYTKTLHELLCEMASLHVYRCF